MTGCGVYLMIMGLVVLVFGIVAIFWQDPIVQLIYSCLGAFLFSIYLIYDTQLIIGNHRYSYSLDDAYLATLKLYVDIIEIFLNILRACGS
jgi:FtsH-binding integral membrane protein